MSGAIPASVWRLSKPGFKLWLGTSLVVQWLRHCTANAGDPGLIPGQGTRFYVLQLKCGWISPCGILHLRLSRSQIQPLISQTSSNPGESFIVPVFFSSICLQIEDLKGPLWETLEVAVQFKECRSL